MQHVQFYSTGVEQSAKEAACERMTHVISEHAADIARILGIQLKGDDLSASLLANIAMCAAENRLIRNPAQTCRDLISRQESRGEPMSISEQDELCQEALELIPFWGGKDSMPVAKVFWNMVYSGRYPLYNSHAWHERMAQIDTVLRGDEGLMQGFRSMSEAAEHLGVVRKSGGRDDVLRALAGFLWQGNSIMPCGPARCGPWGSICSTGSVSNWTAMRKGSRSTKQVPPGMTAVTISKRQVRRTGVSAAVSIAVFSLTQR